MNDQEPPTEQPVNRPVGHRSRTRQACRVACLTIGALLVWGVGPWQWEPGVLPAMSSFVAIASLIASHVVVPLAWLGIVAALVVSLRQRWFCRWICPMGLCADTASSLGRRMGRRGIRFAKIGRWLVWLTLAGSVLGYPLFIWLDPLSLLTGLLHLPHSAHGWVYAFGGLAVLFLCMVWPGLWCSSLCPFGAFQEILYGLRQTCTTRFTKPPKTTHPSTLSGRRIILGGAVGAAAAMIVRRPSSHAKPLRPPGAVHESELGGLCIRCGNCLAVCPSNIIRPDSGKSALTRLFTPTLQFDKDYCHEDCTACTQACPSGALIHVPQEKKATTRIGLPRVDMNLCLLGEDRECAECRNRCPYEAIRYVFSEEQYCLTPQIDESRCNGCGACEAACPVRPVRAIIVSPID